MLFYDTIGRQARKGAKNLGGKKVRTDTFVAANLQSHKLLYISCVRESAVCMCVVLVMTMYAIRIETNASEAEKDTQNIERLDFQSYLLFHFLQFVQKAFFYYFR